MSDRSARRERWAFPVAVLAATSLALALRAYHLAIPLRYDEAVTFLDYASGGFAHAASHYPTPNNHVFNSVLIHGLTSVLGPHPWVIRLPAFLAGVLLVPAVAWMAARRFDRRVGAAAAFLVAATPVLVEYSTNARGYSIVALVTVVGVAVGHRLLRCPAPWGWAAYGALMVVGTYAVPVMLLPWAGLAMWLWVNLFVEEGTMWRQLRRETPLVVATAVAALAVAALYAPVVLENGLRALVGNRFVTPLGWEAFRDSVPTTIAEVGRHWARAVPGPLAAAAAAGVVLALALRPGDRNLVPLGWAVAVGAAAVMLWRRTPGEARIWLWALPLVITASAAGLVAALDRALRSSAVSRALGSWSASRPPGFGGRWLALAVAVAWAAVVAVHLAVDRSLWRSLETGGFMEVEEVAAWLAERVEPRDAVITDFVSWEPLRYYLEREGVDPSALAGSPAEGGRVWVVVNHHEEVRRTRAAGRAAGLGIPLETAGAMVAYGEVEIFGFAPGPAPGAERTPATSDPDPRGDP